MILKLSTAFERPFYIGVTSLSVACSLSKAGGAFAGAGGAVSELSVGWYKVSLNTTDTGTAGALAYSFTGAGVPATIGQPVDQVGVDATLAAVVIQ